MADICTEYEPLFLEEVPAIEQDNNKYAPKFIDFTKAHTFTLFNPDTIKDLNYEHTKNDDGRVIYIHNWMFNVRR